MTKTVLPVTSLVLLALLLAEGFARDTPWASLPAGSALAVTISTGRVIRGNLDPQTDDQHLWLTAEAEGMSISSCLAVADVLKIEPAESLALPPRPQVATQNLSAVVALQPVLTEEPRTQLPVKSIEVFAELANWNGDAKPDGLRVWIQPRAANGEPVAATGSVSIKLAVFRGNWRGSHGSFREGENWFRELSAAEYGESGAVIDLPFENVHPEADPKLLSLGVLSVRLGVVGQGTFDARVEDVSLRSQAFTRDLRLRPRSTYRLSGE